MSSSAAALPDPDPDRPATVTAPRPHAPTAPPRTPPARINGGTTNAPTCRNAATAQASPKKLTPVTQQLQHEHRTACCDDDDDRT